LKTVDGVGESVAAYLFCVGAFYKQMSESDSVRNAPKKWEREEFQNYVQKAYAGLQKEVMDVYLLNPNCEIIYKKRFTGENAGTVCVIPAEFSKLFFNKNVGGLVLVHNHPIGVAEPSKQDDVSTFRCRQLCGFHGVMLCDHIIYAPNGVYSYYFSGRLKRIEAEWLKQTEGIETFWEDKGNENDE
jgi:DNA repair protein RadC